MMMSNSSEYLNRLESAIPEALEYLSRIGQQNYTITTVLPANVKILLTTQIRGTRLMFRENGNDPKYFAPHNLIGLIERCSKRQGNSSEQLGLVLEALVTEIKSIPQTDVLR